MKYYLFLILSIIAFAGCSSSDDNVTPEPTPKPTPVPEPEPIEEDKILVLSIETSQVKVDDKVMFTVQDQHGKAVSDVSLILKDKEITNPYKFNRQGTYSVFAKKKGYKDSNEVTIYVAQLFSLVLKPDKYTTTIGQSIKFDVRTNTGEGVNTNIVRIYNLDSGAPIQGFEFTPSKDGNYSFIAKGGDYIDSDIVTIEVINNNVFVISGKKFAIESCTMTIDVEEIIDASGKSKIVDAVYTFGGGKRGNRYTLEVESYQDASMEYSYNALKVAFFVENTSIKIVDGQIVDYGQRKLPNQVFVHYFSDMQKIKGNDKEIEEESNVNITKFTMRYNKLKVPNKGISSEYGVTGLMGINMIYESFCNIIDIQYNGEFIFKEVKN